LSISRWLFNVLMQRLLFLSACLLLCYIYCFVVINYNVKFDTDNSCLSTWLIKDSRAETLMKFIFISFNKPSERTHRYTHTHTLFFAIEYLSWSLWKQSNALAIWLGKGRFGTWSIVEHLKTSYSTPGNYP